MIEIHDGLHGYLTAVAKFQCDSKPDTKTPAGFMLAHGRMWKFDASSFEGSGEPGACFSNAGMRALDDEALTYVEGHVSVGGVPLDHAWLVDGAGHVVDPTLTSDLGRGVAGYFGVPIKTSYLRKRVMRDGRWGVLQYDNAKYYLRDSPKRIVTDKDWSEEDHPRHPQGVTEGGQFAPKGGGGTTPTQEPEGAERFDPAVVAVGGDDWNKATALRLEREYQSAKPALEKLVALAVGKEGDAPDDDDEDVEDHPLNVPESWDDLTSDMQVAAEEIWKEQNHESFMESEISSWQENSAPQDAVERMVDQLDEARTKGVGIEPEELDIAKYDQFTWADDAIEAVREKREEDGQPPIPYSNDQLILALEMKSKYEGEFELDFSDTWLKEPQGFEELPQFPDMGTQQPADRLTKEMRTELLAALEKAAEARRDDIIQDMPAPTDMLEESVSEMLDDYWDQKGDDDKFNFVKESGVLDLEDKGSTESGPIVMPSKFMPLDDLDDDNYPRAYKDTQRLARHISIQRTAQLMVERGLADEDSALSVAREIDASLWSDWKSSSTSLNGKMIQLASTDELGARESAHFDDKLVRHDSSYDGVKAAVRAKWETTQWLLEKAGIKELKLYRGIRYEYSGKKFDTEKIDAEAISETFNKISNAQIKRNGAASWTTSKSVANGWVSVSLGIQPVILRANVPRTAILSVPAYGINIHEEKEVVAIGTAWKAWDAWEGKAPDVKDHPIR